MTDEQEAPMVGDAAAIDRIRAAADQGMENEDLKTLALSLGVQPPNGDPLWLPTLAWDAAGNPPEGQLVWWIPAPDEE